MVGARISQVVGTRHPFAKDPDLDYEIDSDEEWEELETTIQNQAVLHYHRFNIFNIELTHHHPELHRHYYLLVIPDHCTSGKKISSFPVPKHRYSARGYLSKVVSTAKSLEASSSSTRQPVHHSNYANLQLCPPAHRVASPKTHAPPYSSSPK
ncbi:Chromatin assembly factor 1 subunit A [Forsythia ovata]|uniref:Chromatin assembly factor 1 subunit A n=1 Tax=Forsythia ovata TaxID=205694 RepID=A0ABD1R5J0_9LAMI